MELQRVARIVLLRCKLCATLTRDNRERITRKFYQIFFFQVKLISLSIDDRELTERGAIEIRRAPGHCHFDFGQRIPLMITAPADDHAKLPAMLSNNLYSALSLLSPRSAYSKIVN